MTKNYCLEASVTYRKKSELYTWQNKCSVELGKDTSFADVLYFMEEVKKIVAKIKSFYLKHGENAEYNLCFESFGYNFETGELSKFNCWRSNLTGDVNEEGIYFRPDERYTEPEKDMYVSYKEPLKDIGTYCH